jgi:hypothetical protein
VALKLNKQYKGITTEYNSIIATGYLKSSNTTSVSLGAYVNEDTRRQDVTNFIGELAESFCFEGELTRADLYKKIKESQLQLVSEEIPEVKEVKEIKIIVEAKPAVKDSKGKIIEPEVKKVTEEVIIVPYKAKVDAVYKEINKWTKAEDC